MPADRPRLHIVLHYIFRPSPPLKHLSYRESTGQVTYSRRAPSQKSGLVPATSLPTGCNTSPAPNSIRSRTRSNKFLNARTDGAVLPILHLSGFKIANPTLLDRISHEELDQLLRGYGWTPIFVEGDQPESMHQAMASALDSAIGQILEMQRRARQ